MSRAGYSDDLDQWSLIRWRGAVASSMRGKRGQAFLRELVAALDAMPKKRLISQDLQRGCEVCAIGAVGMKRGVELQELDPSDYEKLAGVFGIAAPLVQEIEWMNDEGVWAKSPEDRWKKMRAWAVSLIKSDAEASDG